MRPARGNMRTKSQRDWCNDRRMFTVGNVVAELHRREHLVEHAVGRQALILELGHVVLKTRRDRDRDAT